MKSTELRTIVIPSSVRYIGPKCFYESRLEEVFFESNSNLVEIDEWAFHGLGPMRIQIPASVEVIGKMCFSKLQEITFERGSRLKRIGSGLPGTITTLKLPGSCRGEKELAPWHLEVFSFDLESGLPTEFWDDMLMQTKIAFIDIPRSIESIGKNCFEGCRSLWEVSFESGSRLKSIGCGAFRWCNIQSITIPRSVEVIGDECFKDCFHLMEVEFESESQLRQIGNKAFNACPIKRIRIPSRTTIIGNKCFSGFDDLCEFVLESGSELREIGSLAFHSTGLDHLAFMGFALAGKRIETASRIIWFGTGIMRWSEEFVFIVVENSTLMSPKRDIAVRYLGCDEVVSIGRVVKCIYEDCFEFCKTIHELSIEKGCRLHSIGKAAFIMSSLRKIRIPGTVEYIGSRCFWNCRSLCKVEFERESRLREIGESAFAHCRIEMISIPYRVEMIGNGAFENCSSLSRVTFEVRETVFCHMFCCFGRKRTMKELMREVFLGSRLEWIVIPSTIEVIRERCFYGCECLERVTFERRSNLIVIESFAFSRSGLRSVMIPESVERIESFCFYECEYLSEIEFEPGCELLEVGFEAFGQTGVQTVAVPMIPVSDSPSDPNEPSNTSSISRMNHWKWMRDHEEGPIVVIVRSSIDVFHISNESGYEQRIVEKPKKKSCCSTYRVIHPE
jgi:hypothetical protein